MENSQPQSLRPHIVIYKIQGVAIQNYLWWKHMHLGLYKLFVENTYSKCTLPHISYQ